MLETTMAVTLVGETCCNCGVPFGMAQEFRNKRLKDHLNFYCPNGHRQHYVGQTEEERLRNVVENLKQEVRFQKGERTDAELKARAARGQVTKIKNRVKAGLCVFCKRHFTDMQKHMAAKHHEEPTR